MSFPVIWNVISITSLCMTFKSRFWILSFNGHDIPTYKRYCLQFELYHY